MAPPTRTVSTHDRRLLRDLAHQVAEVAARPEQAERVRLWKALNALRPERPMVLANPQNGWAELLPSSVLGCEDPGLRAWEWQLRAKLYRHRHIPDDFPVTSYLDVSWIIHATDFGVQGTQVRTDPRGAYRWDPPIKTPADLRLLRPRRFEVDHESTRASVALAQELVGDILQVRLQGETTCRQMLTRVWIHLRGLDQMMVDMYDNPNLLHDAMAFLRDEFLRQWELYEREGVLSLNNGPDHITGSGGIGATDDLPAPDYAGRTRMKDMWCWAESQETVGVGPQHFWEFVLQYQLPLINRFGLVDYGCCEPLDHKIDLLITHIPHLRWVSVSPWADRAVMAQKLGSRYVYVYKPNPALICSPRPDFAAAEQEVRETLEIARGCCVSLIMKDTHTFHNEPGRITRWAEMAIRAACEAR